MTRLSRGAWIGGALEVLCEGGIETLRVEPLAKSLGVTKGSFYHHFDNRRSLHIAMLTEWERLGTVAIIDEVEEATDDPIEQLRRLAARTFAEDPTSDAIETAIRSWAANDEVAAEVVARVDEQRLRFVTRMLRAAGLTRSVAERRARLMYRLLIGEFVWRSTGGPATTQNELGEMVDLLLADL